MNYIRLAVSKYQTLPTIVKASFWFLICSFLQKGIAIISTPIFTRLMTPAEFGSYSVFNSWLSILSVIITLNLFGGVYIQGLVKFSAKQFKFSSAVQGLTLTLVVVWFSIYLCFSDYCNNLLSLNTSQVCCMFLLIWLSAVFCFWSAQQRVLNKYISLVIVSFTFSLLSTLLGIILVIISEDKVTARILSLVIIQVALYSILFITQIYRGKCFFDWKIWKYVLLFNLPLLPHYLSSVLLNTIDKIMIEKMIGVSESGLYSLAFSIGLLMTLFNTALMQSIEPWLYKRIKMKNFHGVAELTNTLFIFIASINVLLIAIAPELIKLFAPIEYYESIWAVPPIAMTSFFIFAYSFFIAFEFYYEKTLLIALATIIGAVIKVALNFLLLENLSYYVAGYTTLLCFMILAGMHLVCMQYVCKKNLENNKIYDLRSLFLVTVTFLAVGFIFLISYFEIVIRYTLLFFLVIVFFLLQKKFIMMIKEVFSLRTK